MFDLEAASSQILFMLIWRLVAIHVGRVILHIERYGFVEI